MIEDMPDKDLFVRLAEAVTTMKPELVAQLARKVLEQGLSPQDAMTQGLAAGMRRMGEKFAAKECFVPEVLLASKAMYAGFDILSKAASYKPQVARGKVALGVVQGDIHDIGKNLVKMMLEVSGFEIHDLGRDVEMDKFAEEALRVGADLLCMSALMTTTIIAIKDYLPEFRTKLPNTKIMIGGALLSQHLADEWGADGYGENAMEAARVALRLVGA